MTLPQNKLIKTMEQILQQQASFVSAWQNQHEFNQETYDQIQTLNQTLAILTNRIKDLENAIE
jgi:flagellar biosynthesis chaperone FliJ